MADVEQIQQFSTRQTTKYKDGYKLQYYTVVLSAS